MSALALHNLSQPIVKQKVDPQEYLHIAEITARRFCQNKKENIKDTEIYAEACLSLIKIANEGYDPKIAEFSSLAYKVVENHLKSYIRKAKRKKRTATFEALNNNIAEKYKEPSNTIPMSLFDTLLKVNDNDDSEQDKLDKLLLQEVYLKKNKIGKIAKEYNVSRMTIYNWLDRVIKKIRRENKDLVEKYGILQN